MMYGFGDVISPLPESLDIMEELVFEYVQQMTMKAMQVSAKRGRFITEDLIFLVRKDKKKHARAKELLFMWEEIRKARSAFESDDVE